MLDGAVVVLAYLFGCGSLLLMAGGMGGYVDLHLSRGAALAWDGLLSLAFFLQHSVMVRRPVKARLARHLPARYGAAVYAIASGAVLAAAVVLWQRTEVWFTPEGPLRWALRAGSLLALAGFVWGAASLRGFDPLGTRGLRRRRAPESEPPAGLQVRGPYRWVRHPLYACVLVLIWTDLRLGADRLLFDVLWSAWIVVGAALEERDLIAELGPPYVAYRRRVPMLIPHRPPAAVDLAGPDYVVATSSSSALRGGRRPSARPAK